ncbi:bactofilin family protein [Hydrogenimonas sp.]
MDGEVDGDVRAKRYVIVTAEGVVHGNIEAADVYIGGTVHGDIWAIELELFGSAKCHGEIEARRITKDSLDEA